MNGITQDLSGRLELQESQDQPLGRGKRWRIRLALLACGLLLVLAVGELGLRLMGVSYPRTFVMDYYRGPAYRPGIEFWQREEGKALVKINDDGVRDENWSLEKPPNTIRIAVLGDSYTDAIQVAKNDRFTEAMNRELERMECFGTRKIEVLNFGTSGYGTCQEMMVLQHCAVKYDPDIVVLAFMSGNDVRNNSKQMENDPGRPYFVLENGTLEFDDSFRNSKSYQQTPLKRLGYWAIDRSRILQTAYRVRAVVLKRRAYAEAGKLAVGLPTELGLDTAVYREPQDPLWIEAWEVSDALLGLMNKTVREKNARFLVVTLSNSIQDHPDPTVRQEFMDALDVEDLSYPDERVRSVGDREGFPVLILAPSCREYSEKNQIHLHGFANTALGKGHWNENGHHLGGKLIAREISRLWGSEGKQPLE